MCHFDRRCRWCQRASASVVVREAGMQVRKGKGYNRVCAVNAMTSQNRTILASLTNDGSIVFVAV